jgi:hypothetical protein
MNDRTPKHVDDDVFAWAVIGTLCGGVTLALWGALLWESIRG